MPPRASSAAAASGLTTPGRRSPQAGAAARATNSITPPLAPSTRITKQILAAIAANHPSTALEFPARIHIINACVLHYLGHRHGTLVLVWPASCPSTSSTTPVHALWAAAPSPNVSSTPGAEPHTHITSPDWAAMIDAKTTFQVLTLRSPRADGAFEPKIHISRQLIVARYPAAALLPGISLSRTPSTSSLHSTAPSASTNARHPTLAHIRATSHLTPHRRRHLTKALLTPYDDEMHEAMLDSIMTKEAVLPMVDAWVDAASRLEVPSARRNLVPYAFGSLLDEEREQIMMQEDDDDDEVEGKQRSGALDRFEDVLSKWELAARDQSGGGEAWTVDELEQMLVNADDGDDEDDGDDDGEDGDDGDGIVVDDDDGTSAPTPTSSTTTTITTISATRPFSSPLAAAELQKYVHAQVRSLIAAHAPPVHELGPRKRARLQQDLERVSEADVPRVIDKIVAQCTSWPDVDIMKHGLDGYIETWVEAAVALGHGPPPLPAPEPRVQDEQRRDELDPMQVDGEPLKAQVEEPEAPAAGVLPLVPGSLDDPMDVDPALEPLDSDSNSDSSESSTDGESLSEVDSSTDSESDHEPQHAKHDDDAMSLDSSSSSDSDTDSLADFIVPDSPTLSATTSSTPLWSSSTERRRGIDAQRTLLRDLKRILSRAASDRQVRLDLYDDVFRFCQQMGKRKRPNSNGAVFMYLKLAHDEVVRRAWAHEGAHLGRAEAWDVMLDEVTKAVAGAREPVYAGSGGSGGGAGAGTGASAGGVHSSPRAAGSARRGSTAGDTGGSGSPHKRPKYKPHVPTVPRTRKASVTQGQRSVAPAPAPAGVASDDPLAEYLEEGGEPEPTRMINVASAGDPVYVPSFLEDVLQEHQIEGLEFLWRRIVQERGGAILAHAMGLGKSIQIVTFVYLILRGIRHHNLDCPPLLQRCILILCPKTVYPNWVNEINKWVPAAYRKWVGMHVLILDEEPQDRREAMAERWNKYGGVLVSSYDCLKYTVKPKSSAAGAAAGEGAAEAREARMSGLLLNKASLLVMDEAHTVKNEATQITTLLKNGLNKDTIRIALTGTPLQNNLDEYYTLSDLVAPGFLGTRDSFETTKLRIMRGQDADSSRAQRRAAEYALELLSHTLDEFVLRRDNTVLLKQLPPLREVVVFLDLTDAQKALIRLLMTHMDTPGEQAGFMKLYHKLQSVFNHPGILVKKILKAKKELKEYLELHPEVAVGAGGMGASGSASDSLAASGDKGSSSMAMAGAASDVGTARRPPIEVIEISDSEDEIPSPAMSKTGSPRMLNNLSPMSSAATTPTFSTLSVSSSTTSLTAMGPPSTTVGPGHGHARGRASTATAPTSDVTDMTAFEWIDQYLASMDDIHNAHNSSKLNLCLSILQECRKTHEKMLVFSHSVHCLDAIALALDREGIKFSRLDGAMDSAKRELQINQFNRDDYEFPVFIISTTAGSTGINLIRASRVVLYDLKYNPIHEDQALARAYRIGQTRPVFVYRFVIFETIDDAVFKQQVRKTSLARQTLDKERLHKIFSRAEVKNQIVPGHVLQRMDQKFRHQEIAEDVLEEDPVLATVVGETSHVIKIERMKSFFPHLNKPELDEKRIAEAKAKAKKQREGIRSGMQTAAVLDVPTDFELDDSAPRPMTALFSPTTMPNPDGPGRGYRPPAPMMPPLPPASAVDFSNPYTVAALASAAAAAASHAGTMGGFVPPPHGMMPPMPVPSPPAASSSAVGSAFQLQPPPPARRLPQPQQYQPYSPQMSGPVSPTSAATQLATLLSARPPPPVVPAPPVLPPPPVISPTSKTQPPPPTSAAAAASISATTMLYRPPPAFSSIKRPQGPPAHPASNKNARKGDLSPTLRHFEATGEPPAAAMKALQLLAGTKKRSEPHTVSASDGPADVPKSAASGTEPNPSTAPPPPPAALSIAAYTHTVAPGSAPPPSRVSKSSVPTRPRVAKPAGPPPPPPAGFRPTSGPVSARPRPTPSGHPATASAAAADHEVVSLVSSPAPEPAEMEVVDLTMDSSSDDEIRTLLKHSVAATSISSRARSRPSDTDRHTPPKRRQLTPPPDPTSSPTAPSRKRTRSESETELGPLSLPDSSPAKSRKKVRPERPSLIKALRTAQSRPATASADAGMDIDEVPRAAGQTLSTARRSATPPGLMRAESSRTGEFRRSVTPPELAWLEGLGTGAKASSGRPATAARSNYGRGELGAGRGQARREGASGAYKQSGLGDESDSA